MPSVGSSSSSLASGSRRRHTPPPRNQYEHRLLQLSETQPLLPPSRDQSLFATALSAASGNRRRHSHLLADERHAFEQSAVKLCALAQNHVRVRAEETAAAQRELTERCKTLERDAAAATQAHSAQLAAMRRLHGELSVVPKLHQQLDTCVRLVDDCRELVRAVEHELKNLERAQHAAQQALQAAEAPVAADQPSTTGATAPDSGRSDDVIVQ